MTGAAPAASVRARAFVIDRAAVTVAYAYVVWLGSAFAVAVSPALGSGVRLCAWTAFLGYQFFFVPFVQGTTGQTFGQARSGLRLERDDGSPVGFGRAFVRTVVNTASLGVVASGRTVGDRVVGSQLVVAAPAA